MEVDAQTDTPPTGLNNEAGVSDGSSLATDGASSNGISADEIALYDRQIRLWGMKAQERIRSANILLITLRALGSEIAKNLVLAGIGSLTIVDHAVVTPDDLGAQFFQNESNLGRNRAEAAIPAIQKLNPRVSVLADSGDIHHKAPSFFASFDLVIATALDSPALQIINTATRLNARPLYAGGCHGLYGFVFADLIEHTYILERATPNVPTRIGPEDRSRTRTIITANPKPGHPNTEQVTKKEEYSTWLLAADAALPAEIRSSPRRRRVVTPVLSCLRALWEFQQMFGRSPDIQMKADLGVYTKTCMTKHTAMGLPEETLKADVLRAFMQNMGAEIAPVAAILGAQLAQDVINVLGANQQPIQNFVVFDGENMTATTYALHPEGDLGIKQLMVSGLVNGDAAALLNAHAQIMGEKVSDVTATMGEQLAPAPLSNS